MDFAHTVFRSSLRLEDTLFSRAVFPNLAIFYTLGTMQELTGLDFNYLRTGDQIEATQEQDEALRDSLNSQDHLRDREKLLPFIRGPKVLELGAGSGGFLRLIKERRSDLELLVGVELSSRFFEYGATLLFSDQNPTQGPPTILVRADITKLTIRQNFYDSVVLASIVHEIKSYHGAEAVANLFRNICDGLKPGGRLILYDGFRKKDLSYLTLVTESARQNFQHYLQATPREIRYHQVDNRILLDTSDAIDFATKLQYPDPTSQYGEEYYPFSLADYRDILKHAGFVVRVVKMYPEEIDIARVKNHVVVQNARSGRDELLAHHNVLLVATKVNEQN